MDMSLLMKYTSLNMTFPDSTEKEKEPVERERTNSDAKTNPSRSQIHTEFQTCKYYILHTEFHK